VCWIDHATSNHLLVVCDGLSTLLVISLNGAEPLVMHATTNIFRILKNGWLHRLYPTVPLFLGEVLDCSYNHEVAVMTPNYVCSNLLRLQVQSDV
jgi:hypothetical protein